MTSELITAGILASWWAVSAPAPGALMGVVIVTSAATMHSILTPIRAIRTPTGPTGLDRAEPEQPGPDVTGLTGPRPYRGRAQPGPDPADRWARLDRAGSTRPLCWGLRRFRRFRSATTGHRGEAGQISVFLGGVDRAGNQAHPAAVSNIAPKGANFPHRPQMPDLNTGA